MILLWTSHPCICLIINKKNRPFWSKYLNRIFQAFPITKFQFTWTCHNMEEMICCYFNYMSPLKCKIINYYVLNFTYWNFIVYFYIIFFRPRTFNFPECITWCVQFNSTSCSLWPIQFKFTRISLSDFEFFTGFPFIFLFKEWLSSVLLIGTMTNHNLSFTVKSNP